VPVVASVNSAVRAASAIRARPEATGALLVDAPMVAAMDAGSPPPGTPLHTMEMSAEAPPLDVAPAVPQKDTLGEPLVELSDPPPEGD
ncbi:MAG TPA: hypothetical protein VFH70_07445, partial [Acidimicrobiales bacterium]|nr:hypothetical protein [Acidimicrobiales bacterium]